jgi:hypothetical protein
MRSKCGLCSVAVGLLTGSAGYAQIIAYDNFGAGNEYNTGSGYFVRGPNHASTSPDWTQGFLFTSQASGGITELFLPLVHTGGTNEFRYEIRLDDNQTPGAVHGQFTNVVAGTNTSRFVTILGDGSIQLTGGQSYWLILYAINDASATWYQNNQGDNMLRCLSRNQGATWSYGTLNAPVFRITVDSGPVCYANCDGSTTAPILNVEDFTCFINEFAAAQGLPHEQQLTHYANCDQSTTAPVLNVEDFTCFINAFAQGCP